MGQAPRQAWELEDAKKAKKVIRNLARRLERAAPGVSSSILEGIDEIPTVTRLGLPVELRRSLACTNVIENMNRTIRQVRRNVKRWRDARMALRWTGAAMLEAAKGFRRRKARKQLPSLRATLTAHQAKNATNATLNRKPAPRSLTSHRRLPSKFQHIGDKLSTWHPHNPTCDFLSSVALASAIARKTADAAMEIRDEGLPTTKKQAAPSLQDRRRVHSRSAK